MQKLSLTDHTFSGILWQGTGAGGNLVIRALVIIILARYLTASDFGVVAAAMVIATITQSIAQSGVSKALVQRLTPTEQHYRAGFAISVYTGLAGAAVLVFAAPFFAAAIGIEAVEPVVRLFSVLVLLNGIAAVSNALVQRARRFKLASLIDLIAFTIGFGSVGVTLTFAGFGVWALAIAQVCQVLLRTILYVLAAPPPVGFWPRLDAAKDLYQAGSGFTLGAFGNLIATQIDNFIVGRILGAEQLGLYHRAYQFLMLPAQLIGTTSQSVLFPSVASIQDQPKRVARAFRRATGVIAMTTLPLSGILMVLSPELVVVTLGSHWQGMVLPYQILVASLMFRTSYKVSDSVSLAMGLIYQRAWRQWVYAGAVAAGAIVGARWGLPGVSVGVGAAVVLNFVLMLQLVLPLTGISASSFISVHIRHTLAALPVVAIVTVVVAFARAQALPDFVILGIGSVTAFATFLLMWWRCRWVFGKDGEWAHSLALSRLVTLQTRYQSSGAS